MAAPRKPNKRSRPDSTAENSDNFFCEAGPSRAFTNSTVVPSTSKSGTPQSGKKKLSFRKLSIEAPPDIPLNDDCEELIEEKEKSIAEQEKSINKSSNKAEDETDVSIVKTMTLEQMQEHVSRCLQLSTENKINTKNAFALKLIDCMTIITKNDDESNFTAMACQLDAGAKIYSSRVDAVHQQVMKLVETCMFAEKKKKEKNATDGEAGENDTDEEDEGGAKDKERKKRPRKKVITTNDQISRQPKQKDPKDKFVRLEALPGDILNKAKYNIEDLSLTLDKHTPFWMNRPNYKRIIPEGEVEIPDVDIKSRKLRPKLETDLELEMDLSSLPKLEPHSSPTVEDSQEENGADMDYESSLDPSPDTEDSMETEPSPIEMISVAMTRMTLDGSQKTPSTQEVLKTIFHEPGESDYHYLKMDNSNFWAGPSHWKRPKGHNHAENKRKVVRKKKEPVAVKYTETEVERPMKPSETANKKASTLSKRTTSKWAVKKVTFPPDVHFEPETFNWLFHVNIGAAVVHLQLEEDKDKGIDENEGNSDVGRDDDYGSQDMFATPDEASECEDSANYKSFASPTGSDNDLEFRGFPSSGGSSPIDLEHDGFRGWGSPVHEDEEKPRFEPAMGDCEPGGSCDVYEGENLVPMVKTVKVDPIRVRPRPNRVDMQHLKSVMLNIIRRAIEDRENLLRDEGLSSPRGSVTFREVLKELFSTDRLHPRTKEDLTVPMALLCLLTLTNENNFNLKQEDDILIMDDPTEVPGPGPLM